MLCNSKTQIHRKRFPVLKYGRIQLFWLDRAAGLMTCLGSSRYWQLSLIVMRSSPYDHRNCPSLREHCIYQILGKIVNQDLGFRKAIYS